MSHSLKRCYKIFFHILSVSYVAIVGLFWLSPYWPKSLWWLASILQLAPLWVLVVPFLMFASIALLLKDYKIFALDCLSIVVLLFGVMGFNIPLGKAPMPQKDAFVLRVVTINFGQVRDFSRLKAYIQKVRPDIVALQELNWQTDFQPLFADKKWNFYIQGQFAIASRFKIISTEIKDRQALHLDGWLALSNKYILETPVGPIHFFNNHLETLRSGLELLLRRDLKGFSEIKKVTDKQKTESLIASSWVLPNDNAIIAGDFNMRETNPIYRRAWSRFRNVFSRRGLGFGWTYHTRRHRVRIDHILHNNKWQTITAEVGPDIGSDHRPLMADLVFVGTKESSP